MPGDLIDVRPDERFDETKLVNYLADELEGIDRNNFSVKQFGGGAANLTYELTFPETVYVLRRPPLGKIAKKAHDMAREYKVLSVLHKKFPYAPRAYHYCGDETIIGSEFLIMERKYGSVVRTEVPEQYRTMSNFGEVVSKTLVDVLAEFHNVDYVDLGLGEFGKPRGFVERQIEGWYRRWMKAKQADLTEMDDIYNWLKNNCPSDYPFSIVHNDYKLDNVMLDKVDPSKIVAVLDWDMSTLGTPLSDLGALLTYWVDETDEDYIKQIAMMPTSDVGFYTREQLVKRYSQKTSISTDNIDYYHVLGLFRLVVIIAQIYVRFVRGQTQDSRFGMLGKMIPLFAKKAISLIENK